MTEPQKYRKKPVEIEAMEYVGGNASAIIDWILEGSDAETGPRAVYQCEGDHCTGRPEDHSILIRTLEGDMKASPGDFIIRGTKGEFYPCKPDIFRAIHEMPDAGWQAPHEDYSFPDGTIGTLFAIDADTGKWSEGQRLTHEQAVRISASVLPGITEEQVAQFYDTTMFDSGPKQ